MAGNTMTDMDSTDDVATSERSLEDYLGFARAHADTADTRQWVEDLEAMLRVAWGLMTPDQRVAFRADPVILALEEDVGGGTSAA